MFDRTLFILVSCCLEETRANIFSQVVKNIHECNKKTKFIDKLIVFDNASTDMETLEAIKNFPITVQSNKNIGYWTAIDWCLRNYKTLLNKEFEFLYIIESDLLHFNMHKLQIAENFLSSYPDVGSVRTQKFSVKFKHFYSKYNFLSTFTHDAVNLTAYPSGKKVTFSKCKTHEGIYFSNIHGKLYGLNRIKHIKLMFNSLAKKENIGEYDYFNEYDKYFKVTGILDGGIATDRLASRLKINKVVISSYIDNKNAKSSGYLGTRNSKIIRTGFVISKISGTK